jgi:hypothetical protein
MSGTAANALLAPAQVAPASQAIGGGGISPLAAAMMGRMGASPGAGMSNPLGGIPLGTLAMLMGNRNNPNTLLPNGYMGNGTPGPQMMGDLTSQAAGNVAGGAAGL